MKSLIIAEKPSVAKDIAKALNVRVVGDHWENDSLVISNAVGHLLGLTAPPEIASQFPVIPERFAFEVRDKAQNQLNKLIALMKRPDVDTVINACDAGREGEEIFRLIVEYARTSKTLKRMWLQSMTPGAILQASKNLRSDAQMRPLADAARKRNESDWIVGINVTRSCSRIRGEQTTAGRVQTPTLMIVVAREEAIRAFVAQEYFEVRARFTLAAGAYEATWHCPAELVKPGAPAERLWERGKADAILSRCTGRNPDRIEENTTPSRSAAPVLFDLTTLQREANQRFGLSANNTLKIAQALYQTHKVLTYPRTDSQALPEDYVPTVTRTVEALATQGYAEAARRVLDNGWIRPTKKVFDNSKISDHFAIVPTGSNPQGLSADEAKIYDLVARRLLAVFHPDAEFAVTLRTAWIGDDRFVARGKVLVAQGWQAVYGDAPAKKAKKDTDGDAEAKLPALGAGERGKTESMKISKGETKAPPRFNEATLLSAMEHAGKDVADDALREAMAKKGLGTPATRAATIEKLLEEQYMTREQRNLVPAAKAFELKALLTRLDAKVLLSPELTGDWEAHLKRIEEGQAKGSEFLDGIKRLTVDIVNRSLQVPPAATCEACGKPMMRREAKGNRGYFWGCTGFPACSATRQDVDGKPGAQQAAPTSTSPTGETVACPTCHKPMFRRTTQNGAFWGCSGYPKCKTTLPDADGRPGEARTSREAPGKVTATAKGVTFPCPKCGKALMQRKGANGPFWGCTAYPTCKATLPDDNGKPGVRTADVAGKATRSEVERLTLPPARPKPPTGATETLAKSGAVAVAEKPASSTPAKVTGGPIGSTCPGCQKGTLTLRSARASNRPYAGCTHFPECKYFYWMDKP